MAFKLLWRPVRSHFPPRILRTISAVWFARIARRVAIGRQPYQTAGASRDGFKRYLPVFVRFDAQADPNACDPSSRAESDVQLFRVVFDPCLRVPCRAGLLFPGISRTLRACRKSNGIRIP